MATINTGELTTLRQRAAHIATQLGIPISKWTKADANAAFQALEDFEVDAHVDQPTPPTATRRDAIAQEVPGLTLQEEKILWLAWAEYKARELKSDMGVD